MINAVGDAVMALAFFLTISQIGSLDYGDRVRRRRRRPPLGHRRDAPRARPARRRRREVRADPAPHLAPRRDGRPDARLRPDPRRDDGHRRRLPHLPHAPGLRGRARRAAPCRAPRARDAPRRGCRRARPVGHQARDRVLDDEPDRLHVRRRRAGGVRVRDVPPRHARVLQGAPLPRRRARHPPPGRRAGHPQDGRAPPVDAVHARDLPDRLARARRHPPLRGLLVEGRDPRLRARRGRRARLDTLRRRARSARCSPASMRSVSTSGSSTARPPDCAEHEGASAPRRGPAVDDSSRSVCSRSGRPSSASSRSRGLGAVRGLARARRRAARRPLDRRRSG